MRRIPIRQSTFGVLMQLLWYVHALTGGGGCASPDHCKPGLPLPSTVDNFSNTMAEVGLTWDSKQFLTIPRLVWECRIVAVAKRQ